MRQVFLDTETTGLDPAAGDRIVEIGCIEMVNRRESGRHFHEYLNPERPSHPDAQRVHGLSDEFLATKPRFGEVADAFCEFVGGAELIIHNAAFDVGFLDAELARLSRPPLARLAAKITDNLALAREQYPGKANSLDALCKRLEVDNSKRSLHGALLDARLLAEVYIRMTRGQGSLVADDGESSDASAAQREQRRLDLSRFSLVLQPAGAEEIAEHEALLADLDRACGGRRVWPAGSLEPMA
jgi:DNA polymerase III subunit epsilon